MSDERAGVPPAVPPRQSDERGESAAGCATEGVEPLPRSGHPDGIGVADVSADDGLRILGLEPGPSIWDRAAARIEALAKGEDT